MLQLCKQIHSQIQKMLEYILITLFILILLFKLDNQLLFDYCITRRSTVREERSGTLNQTLLLDLSFPND